MPSFWQKNGYLFSPTTTMKKDAYYLNGFFGYWRQYMPTGYSTHSFISGNWMKLVLEAFQKDVICTLPTGLHNRNQSSELWVSGTNYFADWSLWGSLHSKSVLWVLDLSLPWDGDQVHPFWKAALSLLLSFQWNWMSYPWRSHDSPSYVPISCSISFDSMTKHGEKAQQASLVKWIWYIQEHNLPGFHDMLDLHGKVYFFGGKLHPHSTTWSKAAGLMGSLTHSGSPKHLDLVHWWLAKPIPDGVHWAALSV